MQRAREVQPQIELSTVNAPAIAEVCRRLDGLPLAIELAAARVKLLPPPALLARLDRRLPLLTGGPRDLPSRQRTLRDAIAWSYDLLDADEQTLFRKLSIFTGNFTLREAEVIAGFGTPITAVAAAGDELSPNLDPSNDSSSTLIDDLGGLVDKSMLRQSELEKEPNFFMLETLREFGIEQLERSGELDAISDRHADFFLGLAEAAMSRLRGAERTSWLERLDRAHDNLRAAYDWLAAHNDVERAVRLAGALWQFWWWRSNLAEGRQRLERVMELPGAAAQGSPWARVLTGAGALCETQGDYSAAGQYHDQAVLAWEESGDVRGLAVSLLFRWLVAFNAGDQNRMSAHSSEGLRLFSELNDTWGIAMSSMEQGVEAMRREDNDGADEALAMGFQHFEAIGDRWGVAICQGVQGNVATNRRDYATAARVLAESLNTLLVLNDLWGVATVMPASARLAMEQREVEHAVRISGAVAALHRTLDAPLKVPFRTRFEQNLSAAAEQLGKPTFERVFGEGLALSPAQAVELAVTNIDPKTASPAAGGLTAPAVKLSPREREVARLVATGMTAREMGDVLFISESTIRTHINSILNKLGLRNMKELIKWAVENGYG
jgi:DNA-binding CsgD family transcriptional regulator